MPVPFTMKFTIQRMLLMILLPVISAGAHAEPQRVGLVLSGGGARGLAHIGVIRALEEQNIKIDAIAGTSMGAIVGALYASGRSPDEMEAIALSMDWSQALADLPPRDRMSFRRKQDSRENLLKAQATFDNAVISLPKGVVQGQNLQVILQDQFLHVSDITDFDALPIRFRAVAGDLVTGEAVVFESGSLATAVRASMSIPGLFAPVEMDGRILVDGGIANNLPVDVVKKMGVDRVIAVDIATPLYTAQELDSVLPIIEQLTTLLTFNQLKKQYDALGDEDVLITPDLSDINTAAFEKTADAIARGYDAIRQNRDALAGFQSPERSSREEDIEFNTPVITAIEVDNDSDVSDKLIKSQLNQKLGEPLDEDQLKKDIESIYGYQYFESVQYEIDRSAGDNTLKITTLERSWGNDVLGIGFELFTDPRAESSYNIGAMYRKSGLTLKGGEWFTALQYGQDPEIRSELYLPLDYRQRVFANPYARYGETSYNQVSADRIVSRYRIDEVIYGLFIGPEISNKAILGIGIERHDGDIKTYVGPAQPQALFDDDLIYALLEYDTLDNVSFPGSGGYLKARYEVVRPDTAGTPDHETLRLSMTAAVPFGRHSLVLNGDYVGSNTAFVQRHLQATLGGFKRLSGMRRDALVGNNLGYVSLTYLHRLDQQSILPVDLPVYLGVAVEAGNVWRDRSDMALNDTVKAALVMMGVDTPMGPLFAGYGRTEDDDNAFYLKLGHLF